MDKQQKSKSRTGDLAKDWFLENHARGRRSSNALRKVLKHKNRIANSKPQSDTAPSER